MACGLGDRHVHRFDSIHYLFALSALSLKALLQDASIASSTASGRLRRFQVWLVEVAGSVQDMAVCTLDGTIESAIVRETYTELHGVWDLISR